MSKKKIIIAVISGGGLLVAAYFAFESLTYVSTDNAQVGAHLTMLSSRVNGTILKVLVVENQKVKSGDVLAQIDTSDYSNATDAAEGLVESLAARAREAEVNFRRSGELLRTQAISKERYDNAQATFKDTEAKLKAAQAQLDQAKLNISYTKIVAPTDGTISRTSVEVGQFVPAGQPLFGFVETNERWVTANLKETELEHVHVGSRATIDVDALSGRRFTGEVESISPSTGAVFSLLPPDNATGNFTKVVQRVPVRVKLHDISPEEAARLQAGLSAVVSIRIR